MAEDHSTDVGGVFPRTLFSLFNLQVWSPTRRATESSAVRLGRCSLSLRDPVEDAEIHLPDLNKKLCDKFSKIFAERHMPPTESAMHWGFCCGDGWFWLIYELCRKIQAYLHRNPSVPQLLAKQVKSKLGTLHFYHEGGYDFTGGMVDLAQSLSYSVCETCGTTIGVGHTSGWIETCCEAHCTDRKTWKRYESQ